MREEKVTERTCHKSEKICKKCNKIILIGEKYMKIYRIKFSGFIHGYDCFHINCWK
jgi:hypothetical protein